jgi:5-methylcytosine-specific restriction endonuclease McrA
MKPRRRKESTEIVKFRSSNAWAKKRIEIKKRDLYLCQACKAKGIYTYEGLEVHHIVPLDKDFSLRLDGGNLVTLCGRCHEEAERMSK